MNPGNLGFGPRITLEAVSASLLLVSELLEEAGGQGSCEAEGGVGSS